MSVASNRIEVGESVTIVNGNTAGIKILVTSEFAEDWR